ncbi:hypothetical protein EC988_000231 [Linderina pennispora]|nr:hypothetical protein EC988_000231 [Linderina pennispora]
MSSDTFPVYDSCGRTIQDGDIFYISLFEDCFAASADRNQIFFSGDSFESGSQFTIETVDGFKYIKAVRYDGYLVVNEIGREGCLDLVILSKELPEPENRLCIVQHERFKSIMHLKTADGSESVGLMLLKASCGLFDLSSRHTLFQFKRGSNGDL